MKPTAPKPIDGGTHQLVIARYCEDLSWLKRISVHFIVYDKSQGGAREKLRERWYQSPDGPDAAPLFEGSVPLENVGCEAHSYMAHIVTHWKMLADVTTFVQGSPGSDLGRIPGMARGTEFRGFDYLGTLTHCDGLGAPHHNRPLVELPGMFDAFFPGAPMPERFDWFGGAQFSVRKERIRAIPLEAWQRALGLCRTKLHACAMERLWFGLFCNEDKPGSLIARAKRWAERGVDDGGTVAFAGDPVKLEAGEPVLSRADYLEAKK